MITKFARRIPRDPFVRLFNTIWFGMGGPELMKPLLPVVGGSRLLESRLKPY